MSQYVRSAAALIVTSRHGISCATIGRRVWSEQLLTMRPVSGNILDF